MCEIIGIKDVQLSCLHEKLYILETLTDMSMQHDSAECECP